MQISNCERIETENVDEASLFLRLLSCIVYCFFPKEICPRRKGVLRLHFSLLLNPLFRNNCSVNVVSIHISMTVGKKITLKRLRWDHNLSFSARAQAQLLHVRTCTYHMGEVPGTLLYIYRNCFMLVIDPSG